MAVGTRTHDTLHAVRSRAYIVYEGELQPSLSGVCIHRRAALQKPTDWIGQEVTPGQIGLINHGGLPKVLTRPGRYPGFPLRNWWARVFTGTCGRAYLGHILASNTITHSRFC